MRRRWFWIGGSIFVIVLLLGTGLGYVYWKTRNAEQATCLAYAIDQRLDQFAIQKGSGRSEIVERQIEAIARVEILRASKDPAGHCPASFLRWNVWSRVRYTFGAKEGSQRWRLVFPEALRAMRGQYRHPWPKEWECVNEYAATKSIRNWGKRWSNRSKKAGDIANLSLYCI